MFPAQSAAEPAVDKSSMDVQSTGQLATLSDERLLRRFFNDREDAAFGVLVERHGPLVYGVCRRILADANDAEDAFQATFLVLVRKGASLRDPSRLPSWLYGVAHRTARKARSKAALRARSERQASAMATRSDVNDMTYQELQTVLDEEISRLPEKYALPLVLCYLEGKTNAQAAAQLGWPEGSISRRLSKARELLRSRLARRGLALSAALMTAVFARPAVSAVPGPLLATTARAAALLVDGADLEEVVSPKTAALVKEVVHGMSVAAKFSLPTMVVMASLLLVITTVAWQFGAPAHAASLLNFRRGDAVHGRLSPATTNGSMQVIDGASATAAACGASSCGAVAQPAASAGCGTATP